jgi:hypothetical protein
VNLRGCRFCGFKEASVVPNSEESIFVQIKIRSGAKFIKIFYVYLKIQEWRLSQLKNFCASKDADVAHISEEEFLCI